MNAYRVTKYNPEFRSENGNYIKEEWTSISDIGRIFEFQEFSLENYLQAEISYLNAVCYLLDINKIDSLYVSNLVIHSQIENNKTDEEMRLLFKTITENKILNRKEILITCKLVLREQLWCKLVNKNYSEVHFGYDYYMYFLSLNKIDPKFIEANLEGIFIEPIPDSPYSDEE